MTGIHHVIPIVPRPVIAAVYRPFYGVDINGAELVLPTTPNADAARASWGVFCTPLAEETFESYTDPTDLPITTAHGGSVVGTFTNTGAADPVALGIRSNVPGSTNTVGRYSLPTATSSKFLQGVCLTAGHPSGYLKVAFDVPLKAFGIWCTDLGDFQGTLTLEYYDVSDNLIYSQNLDITVHGENFYNASVSFVGLIADGSAVRISSVLFKSVAVSGDGDYFGLDRLTVALT